MKDLIAKLQLDANCALGAIWLHIDAQAARIAELEAQIADKADTDIPEALELLAAVFDAWENGDDCYEDPEECAGFLGQAFRLDDDIFNRCVELLNRRNPPRNAALQPADTDKLRKALPLDKFLIHRTARCFAVFSESDDQSAPARIVFDSDSLMRYVEEICNLFSAQRDYDADRASMAAQTPVREVPEGWKLVPVEPTDAMLEAIEDAAKAECSIEWDSLLGGNLHFGDPSRVYADMIAAAPLPAAPVQEPKP